VSTSRCGLGGGQFHVNRVVDGGANGVGLGRSTEHVVDAGRPRTRWLVVENEKEASMCLN
jgi:hypothetical protein